MFEYFPGNYVWNLGVVATLNSGGLIDEVDRACRPIRDSPPANAGNSPSSASDLVSPEEAYNVALVEAARGDLTGAGRIAELSVVAGEGPLTVDVVLADQPAG